MHRPTRRQFAAVALAAPALAVPAALLTPARPALAQTNVGAPPPVARHKVGRFTVSVLSDGYLELPYATFTGADPAALETRARAAHRHHDGGLRIGFSVWLVDDGERLVLIDSGTGGAAGPTTGRLDDALAALGVAPEDIDAVAVTHMHFDHISGLVAGGRRAFPNAEIYVDRRDVAYFTDAAEAAAAPDLLTSSFAQAAEVVRLYPDLQRIDGEREIARGISSVDLSGHTPGHIGWRIADGDRSLTITGDMLFHPTLHPRRADLGVAFEPDAAAAAAMRRRFFPRAAEQGGLLAATHMPFPGLGRIVRDGDALSWTPAEWDLSA